MKLEYTKKGFSLTDLTMDEINAIIIVAITADERCFLLEDKQANGDYHSNEDFVCVLSGKQRKALSIFCKSYLKQLDKMVVQKK